MNNTDILLTIIGIVQTIGIPWAVWVTRSIYENKSAITINDTKDENVEKNIESLSKGLEEVLKELRALNILIAKKGLDE